jgi:hypothetical protein
MQLIWYPNGGTPITFSRDATNFRLLRRITGWSYVDVQRVTADKAPGQHGVTPIDDLFSERKVSFDIVIQSSTLEEQQALVAQLANALNPTSGSGVLKRINEDGDEYNLYCKPDLPTVSTDGTLGVVNATLNFIAQDPFIYAGSPQIVFIDPNPTNFFPFGFPFSMSSGTATATATNDGQVESPAIITIWGPITNPILAVTRSINGVSETETLTFTMTLVAGDSVVVNTDPDVMTARYYPAGGGDLNAMQYVNVGSSFWSLNPGSNSIHITKTTSSSGSSATVQWSDKYIGI